jgi:hypothetical protein
MARRCSSATGSFELRRRGEARGDKTAVTRTGRASLARHIEYRHVMKPSVSYLEKCGRLVLTSREMGAFLGVPHAVLQQLVYTDRVPLPMRLGLAKCYRWSVLELLEWVE